MTSPVPLRDLRNHTAEVLRRVEAGNNLIVTRNGVPVASLGPIRPASNPMPKADLLRLLDRSRRDPDFAADVAALTSDSTDDLGPIR